jgi:hypothetical protein
VSIVVVEDLKAYLQPLDQPAKCMPDIAEQPPRTWNLKPLSCSLEDYQQITACGLANISASATHPRGQVIDVTQHANLSVSNTTAWQTLPNLFDARTTNRLKPLSESRTAVVMSLGAMASPPLLITAANKSTSVSVAELAATWTPGAALDGSQDCSYQCARTFSALPGTSQPLNVSLTLSDGSIYDSTVMRLVQQGLDDVLNISKVLQFVSEEEAAIRISPRGNAQLLTNSLDLDSIEASTVCTESGTKIARSVALYGNLKAASMDVDAGATFGPAIQGKNNLTAPPVPLQVCYLLQESVSTSCVARACQICAVLV